jgi:carbamoyl-phosphate synthase small subunit
MMSALAVSENEINENDLKKKLESAPNYNDEKFMDSVSTKHIQKIGHKPKNIVLVDIGTKNAIIRNILDIGYNVVKVPWNTGIEEILKYNPEGVVISNGPGDPQNCSDTISTAKSLIENNIPTLGICLGAQILGIAGDAKTYKLKYGHRGQNKPCVNVKNNQVYVTSQNHGYCISPDSLKNSKFDLWFSNVDDKTVEGIIHENKKCIAVQFHPEASPGPYDCKFIFEELKNIMEEKVTG